MTRRSPLAKPAVVAVTEEVPGEELQRLFGENFRAARLKAGLSQTKVSELSGMGQDKISAMELGKVNLTLQTMDRLARVVDGNVGHFLLPAKGKTVP